MAIISDKRKSDAVKHPKHYELPGLGIECIDVIHAVLGDEGFGAYCRGNAIKYLTRADQKGGVEDLEKAAVYLGWEIESRRSLKGPAASGPMSQVISTCDGNAAKKSNAK